MKYKIGDKVRVREDLEVGKSYNGCYLESSMAKLKGKVVEIEYLDSDSYFIKEDKYYWTEEMFSGLAEEPRNLIPQIAKMLSVEIGEEFGIGGGIYKFNEYDFVWVNSGKEDLARNVFYSLLKNEYTIKKLPKKPKLTEAERVILENLDKEYKWIARLGEISNNSLMIYVEKPVKNKGFWTTYQKADILSAFSHLFTFIKWEDEEPYNIEELLKGEQL